MELPTIYAHGPVTARLHYTGWLDFYAVHFMEFQTGQIVNIFPVHRDQIEFSYNDAKSVHLFLRGDKKIKFDGPTNIIVVELDFGKVDIIIRKDEHIGRCDGARSIGIYGVTPDLIYLTDLWASELINKLMVSPGHGHLTGREKFFSN